MRGAPQVGFSATIRRIKARTSLLTRLRPPTRLTLEIQVQYKRNPARCHFTTVLGVTNTRGFLRPDQHVFNATQNSSAGPSIDGEVVAQSQQLLTKGEVFKDKVLPGTKSADHRPEAMPERHVHARILSENFESCLAPSHLFCRCTTFWRSTPRDSPLVRLFACLRRILHARRYRSKV